MSFFARGLGSRRTAPSSASRPSPSSSASSRTSNAQDRIRFVIDALTKPVQLTIHNQQRLEQAQPSTLTSSSTSPDAASSTSHFLSSSASTSLSAPSTLLRSQARLKAGYIDWDDGLSQVKSEVRDSEEGARRVWVLLSERLRANSSEVRLLCLYVIDALFTRSAKFRLLVLDGLHAMLELCVGIASTSSSLAPTIAELPAPPGAAEQLKAEAVATVKRWRVKYGGVYRVLELGHKYMLDALGMEDDAAVRKREAEAKRKKQDQHAAVLRVRFDRLREEWKEKKEEAERCIDTVDGCIDVLFPPEEEWEDTVDREEEKDGSELGHEHAIIDSGVEEGKEASEDGEVDWEIDDDGHSRSDPQPSAPTEAVTAEEDSRGEGEARAAAEGDVGGREGGAGWEDEYLRTGGRGDVWDDGEGAASRGEGDGGGQWDVQRVVADAGLGSGGYQLDIDFDSNLGRMEDEGNGAVFEALRDACRLIQRSLLPQARHHCMQLHPSSERPSPRMLTHSSSSSLSVADRVARAAQPSAGAAVHRLLCGPLRRRRAHPRRLPRARARLHRVCSARPHQPPAGEGCAVRAAQRARAAMLHPLLADAPARRRRQSSRRCRARRRCSHVRRRRGPSLLQRPATA